MSTHIALATAATSPFEPTPEHARFLPLAGLWEGPTTTWFDPSTPPDHNHTQACFEAVLGGRFLRLQYSGTVIGKPHAGEMLFAYEIDEKRYSLAWIDSFHTGTMLMISVGNITADGAISVLGSYAAGDQRWGWRTVLHPNPDNLILEAFNVMPDGTEYPAIKTCFARSR